MNRFSEFAKTPKGKLLLAVCCLLLSWVFLLSQMSGNISSWFPNEKQLDQMQKQQKKLKLENQELERKLKSVKRIRERYKKKKTEEWALVRDGDPETVLPPRVSAAAKAAGLTLNTLGSVKSTRINNDFFYAEIDVSANASLENVVRFVNEVGKLRPQVSWRRFNVNVMMHRKQNSKKSSKTTVRKKEQETAVDTTMLIFNGTLRVIVYDGAGREEKKK